MLPEAKGQGSVLQGLQAGDTQFCVQLKAHSGAEGREELLESKSPRMLSWETCKGVKWPCAA